VDSAEPLRSFGQVFDRVAAAYDDVRSGYPAEFVDAALARGGLRPGSRVLEIGCGTGKLTELLAARGLMVDAVDPGPNMIEVARRRVGTTERVRFRLGRFEELDLSGETFDAVFSAAAFHWLDPRISWGKVAAQLEPRGLLALITHVGLRDDRSPDTDEAFLAVLRTHAPEVAEGWPPPRDLETILAGVDDRRGNVSQVWDWLMGEGMHALAIDAAAALFDDVQVLPGVFSIEQTADDVIALLRTTSLYFRVGPERWPEVEAGERRIVERLGGTLRSSFAVMLMTALRAEVGGST
jgi:SAM-dependent methyltransferase